MTRLVNGVVGNWRGPVERKVAIALVSSTTTRSTAGHG